MYSCSRSNSLARKLVKFNFVSHSLRCCSQKVINTEYQDEKLRHGMAEAISDDSDVDFFGIHRGEGVVDVRKTSEKSNEKIEINDSKVNIDAILKKDKMRSEDKIYVTNFGKIRYDNDNIPTFHGEYDENFDVDSQSSSLSACETWNPILSDEHLDTDTSKARSSSSEYSQDDEFHDYQAIAHQPPSSNFIDEQYFNFDEEKSYKISNDNDDIPIINPGVKLTLKNDLNDIDQQYFVTPTNEDPNSKPVDDFVRKTEVFKPITKYEQKRIDYKPPDIDDPKTAYDYVMKLRKEKSLDVNNETDHPTTSGNTSRRQGKFKLDSLGFRIYEDQVMDFGKLKKDIQLSILKDSVLYDQNDIIALYKPYGLAVQGTYGEHSKTSLVNLLDDLARIFSTKSETIEKLYTVHRLDRETTGILLLAKTQRMADVLHMFFKAKKIKKMYYGITRNVPDIKEGIIDIPIAEGVVNGKSRMVLRPDLRTDTAGIVKSQSSTNSRDAITRYKVISHVDNAALISFEPFTGVKHQIRVHTGFGLSCPILGDHKYSHHDRLAPQKLPGDMLDKLKVRQSKVRHIPMHLHASSIMIPEISDGKNVFIRSRFPRHFWYNMSQLKLKVRGK